MYYMNEVWLLLLRKGQTVDSQHIQTDHKILTGVAQDILTCYLNHTVFWYSQSIFIIVPGVSSTVLYAVIVIMLITEK